jgi:hypothetical protein
MDWNRIGAIANIGCFLAGCFALYDAHQKSSGGFTMNPLEWVFGGCLLGAGVLHFAAARLQTRNPPKTKQAIPALTPAPTPAPEAIAKPAIPQRTSLEASEFYRLKIAFAQLTVPQQYALRLVFEAFRTHGYIRERELEQTLKVRGFGASVDVGIIGPLCCTDFVEQKPQERLALNGVGPLAETIG